MTEATTARRTRAARRDPAGSEAGRSASPQPALLLLPKSDRSGLPLWREVVPRKRLSQLRLEPRVAAVVAAVVEEWRAKAQLGPYGLDARRSVLLVGPPGWGKTSLAAAVAAELGLPCVAIASTGVLSSYLGESGKNLQQVIDALQGTQAVVLWDEIDSLAASRQSSDVGEMRRVCNDLLVALERLPSGVLSLAATNLWTGLDAAVWRRFDVVLPIGPTDRSEIEIVPDWARDAIKGVVADVVDHAATIAAGSTRANILAAAEVLAGQASSVRSPAAAERVALAVVRAVVRGQEPGRAVDQALDELWMRKRIEGA